MTATLSHPRPARPALFRAASPARERAHIGSDGAAAWVAAALAGDTAAMGRAYSAWQAGAWTVTPAARAAITAIARAEDARARAERRAARADAALVLSCVDAYDRAARDARCLAVAMARGDDAAGVATEATAHGAAVAVQAACLLSGRRP